MPNYPDRVRVVEVGPRDGLQAQTKILRTADKLALIDRLAVAGLQTIEVTSLVRTDRLPQFADAEAVWAGIRSRPGVAYPVLVPNRRGLERALAMGVKQIAVFTAASDAFCRRNSNCSLAESLDRCAEVIEHAKAAGLRVRAYLSCALGCPYEGELSRSVVAEVAESLVGFGCDELALGDTVGVGTPLQAQRLVDLVAERVSLERLAIHFHDTRGQALANTLACLQLGVATVDAAVAGLGGCPYAEGAAGNLATEDLVYMLHGMGIETGVDLDRLIDAGRFVDRLLQRAGHRRVGLAGAA